MAARASSRRQRSDGGSLAWPISRSRPSPRGRDRNAGPRRLLHGGQKPTPSACPLMTAGALLSATLCADEAHRAGVGGITVHRAARKRSLRDNTRWMNIAGIGASRRAALVYEPFRLPARAVSRANFWRNLEAVEGVLQEPLRPAGFYEPFPRIGGVTPRCERSLFHLLRNLVHPCARGLPGLLGARALLLQSAGAFP